MKDFSFPALEVSKESFVSKVSYDFFEAKIFLGYLMEP